MVAALSSRLRQRTGHAARVLLGDRRARWLGAHIRPVWPPVGLVRFGSLRRVEPIGEDWGRRRGAPIDRYYMSSFLRDHATDVRGHVLEVGDDGYAREFGGWGAGGPVERVDVLHAAPGNPRATIVADLAIADNIEADSFDCVICTQTLQFVYDLRAAMHNLHRILRPGGAVLLTAPGITQSIGADQATWGEHWRFTSTSMRRLLEEAFPPDHVEVRAYGNVLTATAFLHGLAVAELRQSELETHDPAYEMLIAARAVKPGPGQSGPGDPTRQV